jgi:hypothetical protein
VSRKPTGSWGTESGQGRVPAHLSRQDPAAGAFQSTGPAFFVGTGSGPGAQLRARRRGLRPIPVLSALVVLLLIAAGAIAVAGSSASNLQTKVIDAVDSVLADKTAHLTFDESLSGPTVVEVSGSGDVNFTQNALQFHANIAGGTASEAFDYIYLGDTIYAHVPGIDQLLAGKSWVSVDLSQLAQASGESGSLGSLGSNPLSTLHLLSEQGNTVIPTGPATVDGAAVEGYAIDFSPSVISAEADDPSLPAWMRQVVQHGVSLGTMTSDVYIDGAGDLVRTTNTVSETVGSVTVTLHGQEDYSNFGETIAISPPPAAEVASFQQLLQAAGSSISTALGG